MSAVVREISWRYMRYIFYICNYAQNNGGRLGHHHLVKLMYA